MNILTTGLMGIFSLSILSNAFICGADGLICKMHLFSFFDNDVTLVKTLLYLLFVSH
jgi:hypothetical protein